MANCRLDSICGLGHVRKIQRDPECGRAVRRLPPQERSSRRPMRGTGRFSRGDSRMISIRYPAVSLRRPAHPGALREMFLRSALLNGVECIRGPGQCQRLTKSRCGAIIRLPADEGGAVECDGNTGKSVSCGVGGCDEPGRTDRARVRTGSARETGSEAGGRRSGGRLVGWN
jgi:hypothetical protein